MFRQPSEDQSLRPRFTRRALLVGAAQLGLFGLVGHRLYHLQVERGDRLALLADRNRINVLPLASARGRILDARGRPLAYSSESFGVAVVPDLAGSVPDALDRLAQFVEISGEERERVIALSRRQQRVLPIPVDVALTWEQFSSINVLAPRLPGLEPTVRYERRYEHGDAMAHMLGFVGAVERFELGGDPSLRLQGVRVGKAGVEHGRDVALRGHGGLIKREIDARGRIVRQIERTPPTPGVEVQMTVDVELQRKVLSRVGREGTAALVALDIVNGDVVAMASSPSFDQETFEGGISQDEWARLANAKGNPLLDRTIQGQYPPGSTFKMVTALAGLEAGAITPRTVLRCPGSYTLGGHRFRCHASGGHGSVRLHQALRSSCNVYFYKLAQKIGIARLSDMGRRLGVGGRFEFELAHQGSGLMPTPGWKRGTRGEAWFAGETLLAGIGQGYVLVTPLQLAVMTARLASGLEVQPRLTRTLPDGSAAPEVPLFTPLGVDGEGLRAIQKGMHAVVNRGGTARVAQLGISGAQLAGKTGTAQVRGRGRFKKSHSLFVGYAPYNRPRYAVAAIVEHGGGGSKRAAPLVRDVMRMVIGHRGLNPDNAVVPPVASAPRPEGRG